MGRLGAGVGEWHWVGKEIRSGANSWGGGKREDWDMDRLEGMGQKRSDFGGKRGRIVCGH